MAVMLKEGCPTDDMVAYHEAKAKGGAALTIIEAARVHPSGNSRRQSQCRLKSSHSRLAL